MGSLATHLRGRCLGSFCPYTQMHAHAGLSYRLKFRLLRKALLASVCGDSIQNTNTLHGLGVAHSVSAGLPQTLLIIQACDATLAAKWNYSKSDIISPIFIIVTFMSFLNFEVLTNRNSFYMLLYCL